MMKKLFVAAALAIAAVQAAAQTPLKSATWRGPDVACGYQIPGRSDDVMPLDNANHWETQNAPPGAGVWPAGYSVTVRKVCVTHGGSFSAPSYAVVGHSGPNGDHVSPYVNVPWTGGTECMSYEKDAPVVVTGGEYFDVHANCASGTHHVILQLWYTQP